MRLIDADSLKQRINFRMWDVDDIYPLDEANNRISEDHAVKKIIGEMPTIEAEPVIQCKDCKHSTAYYHGEHSKLGMITYSCAKTLCNVKAYDFCSFGERKEEHETD